MEVRIKYILQYPKKETSPIQAILRVNGKIVKRSLGYTVPTAYWASDAQRCHILSNMTVRTQREYKKINKAIESLEKRWDDYRKGYNITSKSLLSQERLSMVLTNLLSGSTDEAEKEDKMVNRTPLEYFEEYVATMTSRVGNKADGRKISEKTQGHHRTVLKRLRRFMLDVRAEDSFELFDNQFERRFTAWANNKGFAHNTIIATFSILKVWLRNAQEEKLPVSDNYKRLPSKGKYEDNFALTEDEIRAIYELDIPKLIKKGQVDSKSTMENTRDLFIIGCWTGLRRADLCRINDAVFDLEHNRLQIQTQKTNEKVIIPLHPYVRELYLKYGGNFPKLIDKSKANAQLKELGRLAGVNTMITLTTVRGGIPSTKHCMKYQCIGFHTARRSFATNLYLRNAPTISIMKMTGHKTEANFLRYINVSKEQHAAIIAKTFADCEV